MSRSARWEARSSHGAMEGLEDHQVPDPFRTNCPGAHRTRAAHSPRPGATVSLVRRSQSTPRRPGIRAIGGLSAPDTPWPGYLRYRVPGCVEDGLRLRHYADQVLRRALLCPCISRGDSCRRTVAGRRHGVVSCTRQGSGHRRLGPRQMRTGILIQTTTCR